MLTLYPMITGIGLDTIEKERIAKAVSRWGSRFLRRVYTDRERHECERKQDRIGSLAARFAAKEAGMKALGTGWGKGVGWTDIEVAAGKAGLPCVVFHGKAHERMRKQRAYVSLTHDECAASAVVVIETVEE
jgi:holo-[acyl-carrier protein] synthase